MANGPHRITNGPFDSEFYKSEHEVQDPELKVRFSGDFLQRNEVYFTTNHFLSPLDFTTELCQPQDTEEKEKEGNI